MDEKLPLVSICVPTFNAGKFIKETLDSIANQSYENIELIVVDNCSSDRTIDIAKEVLKKHPNFKIIINDENIGGEANFNKCFRVANGDYIAIYHADDVYHEDIVKSCVKQFQSDKNVGAVSTLGHMINSESKTTGKVFSLPSDLKKLNTNSYSFDELYNSILLNSNSFLICPSVMVSKKTLDQVGGFEFDKFKSSSDVGLWLKISKDFNFCIIEKELISYRIHEGQGSESLIRKSILLPDSLSITKYFCKNPKNLTNFELIYINRNILLSVFRRRRSGKKTWCKKLLKVLIFNVFQMKITGGFTLKRSLFVNSLVFLFLIVDGFVFRAKVNFFKIKS